MQLLRELCRWPASREALLLLSPSRDEEVLTPVLLSLLDKAPTHTAIRAMAVARYGNAFDVQRKHARARPMMEGIRAGGLSISPAA